MHGIATFIKHMFYSAEFWSGFFVVIFILQVDQLIDHFDYGNMSWTIVFGAALVFWGWTYASELPPAGSDGKTDTGRNVK